MPNKPIWPILLVLAGCAQTPASPIAPTPEAPDPAAGALAPAPASEASAAPAAPRYPARWRRVNRVGQAVASSGPAKSAVDGETATEWNPREFIAPGKPQWLAVPLEQPANGRLAVLWHGHGMHYQNYGYGRPRTYVLEVSADSTDGRDGTWRAVESVAENDVRSRVAAFEAPGARWVRMTITDVWARNEREPFIREFGVYEADGAGLVDTWVIFGDSVTSVAFNPLEPYTLIDDVEARHAGYRPLLISGGVGGDRSRNAVERIRTALPSLPPGSLIGMCYGTNDAAHGVPLETYRSQLQAAIDLVKANGHLPLLAVPPWSLNSEIGKYAEISRELAELNGLPPGPDFYTYFKQHPEGLAVDRVHPNQDGIKAIHRLWAEAADFRYPD